MRPAGAGGACIGLGLAGYGLSILAGVVPHEEPFVGAGLLAFGSVLVTTGTLPRFPASRPWHLASLGAGLLAVVALAWTLTGHAPVGPMLLLAILGASLLASAAFHGHSIRAGRHGLALRDLAPCAAVAIGVPLFLWLVQASFKRLAGVTPLEAFEVFLLVQPVHWTLGRLGVPSTMDGQTLTLPGPDGLLSVQVGVACSGLQAMALFLGILALFALAERPSGPRLAAWTAVGLAGVYVANLLRLLVIVLSGHQWGGPTLEDVHANAGWAFFVAWSLLFALWVRRDLRSPASLA
jgi:exosortase/archaeosortase family protein